VQCWKKLKYDVTHLLIRSARVEEIAVVKFKITYYFIWDVASCGERIDLRLLWHIYIVLKLKKRADK